MTWSIEHHWNGPPWLTVLLLLGAAAPAVGLYWRETTRRSRGMRLALAVIRFTLIAMLLGMIARPALVWKRTAPPPLVVLLDDSRSMAIADRYPESTRRAMADRLKDAGLESDDASRWNLARALLLERGGALPRALAEKYDLRIALLSEAGAVERNSFRSKANGARPPSAVEDMTAQPGAAVLHSQSPDADATRLGGGVRDAMDATRGAVPAAIVLLTDGVNTQGPALAEAADDARLRGVPLFCIGLGLDRPARGLMLSDLLADEAISPAIRSNSSAA